MIKNINNNDSYNNELVNQISSEDIDLGFTFNTLIRNKKLISTFAIIFFSFAFLISISKRKIWQGEFDIVLSNINLLEIKSKFVKK